MFSISGAEIFTISVIGLMCGWLGYRIGAQKGRAVQGAILGVVLSVVGLIIVALLPVRTTEPN
jgi:uncharacterized membrane protein YeaQ/YmgE (transglycosylase-associated protein family)